MYKVKATTGDTPNIFIFENGLLKIKIWIYPDGKMTYRDFTAVPNPTPEIEVIS